MGYVFIGFMWEVNGFVIVDIGFIDVLIYINVCNCF